LKKIGGGGFGEIYKVQKIKNGEILAAKVEKTSKNKKRVILYWESKLIHILRGKTAIPNLHYVGEEKCKNGKSIHIMVMDLLG